MLNVLDRLLLDINLKSSSSKTILIPRWLKKRSVEPRARAESETEQQPGSSRRKRSSSVGRCAQLEPGMRTTVVKGAGDYYEEGNTIKVECAEGFKLVNGRSKSRYRCKGGLWKPSRPQCVVRDCSPPEVHHAEVREVNGSQVSLSVTCHSGYRLKGPANIVCSLGRWQPNIPVCLGVPCHLPKIKHGSYFRHRYGRQAGSGCQDKTSHSIFPNIYADFKLT